MPEKIVKNGELEQQICVSCGYCCDATLFNTATVDPDEIDNLPLKLKENLLIIENKDYFRLPCPYFEKKCSIYHQKRANICSSFRCKLLKDFANGKISKSMALETIENVRKLLAEIEDLSKMTFAIDEIIAFRKILSLMIEFKNGKKAHDESKYLLLEAKCNILEILLIRYFKSEKDFDKMIMKNVYDYKEQ